MKLATLQIMGIDYGERNVCRECRKEFSPELAALRRHYGLERDDQNDQEILEE